MDADHATELHAEDAILAASLELSAAQWSCTSRRIQGETRGSLGDETGTTGG